MNRAMRPRSRWHRHDSPLDSGTFGMAARRTAVGAALPSLAQDMPRAGQAGGARRGPSSRRDRSLSPRPPRLRGRSLGLLAIGRRQAARAIRQAPQQRNHRAQRLRADAAAGLHRPAAAARLCAAAPRSGASRRCRSRASRISSRPPPRNTASCRTGRRPTRNSSRPTPRWRPPPASPGIRRSASMPSRPAATAPMTDRPASSATARTRGRSRRRWATTSC